MQLNLSDLYKDHYAICGFLNTEDSDKIIGLSRQKLQEYWELTIQEYDMLVHSDYSKRKTFFKLPQHITLLQHFWFLGFVKFVSEEFFQAFENLKIPPSLKKNYEAAAREQCYKLSDIEGMIVMARGYFGYTSFEAAAEKCKLWELLLATKDKINQDIFQRAAANLQMQEIKNHSRGRTPRF